MNIIIKKSTFQIGYDKDNKNTYKIFFNSYNESIIKSITKTKIILGATTTEKYNTLTFKATSVQTFKQFQEELERETGEKKMNYESVLKMTYNLASQLNYLITNNSKTFLGYSPENLIVIDKNKYIYLSNEYLLDIDDEQVIITFPFSQNEFLMSPELLNIKEIPSYINYKVTYFSFGYLILYILLGDDNLINDNEKTIEEKIKLQMETTSIKNTKLYWLLKRCLVEESKNRSILFI
jgi:hypothetical protein